MNWLDKWNIVSTLYQLPELIKPIWKLLASLSTTSKEADKAVAELQAFTINESTVPEYHEHLKLAQQLICKIHNELKGTAKNTPEIIQGITLGSLYYSMKITDFRKWSQENRPEDIATKISNDILSGQTVTSALQQSLFPNEAFLNRHTAVMSYNIHSAQELHRLFKQLQNRQAVKTKSAKEFVESNELEYFVDTVKSSLNKHVEALPKVEVPHGKKTKSKSTIPSLLFCWLNFGSGALSTIGGKINASSSINDLIPEIIAAILLSSTPSISTSEANYDDILRPYTDLAFTIINHYHQRKQHNQTISSNEIVMWLTLISLISTKHISQDHKRPAYPTYAPIVSSPVYALLGALIHLKRDAGKNTCTKESHLEELNYLLGSKNAGKRTNAVESLSNLLLETSRLLKAKEEYIESKSQSPTLLAIIDRLAPSFLKKQRSVSIAQSKDSTLTPIKKLISIITEETSTPEKTKPSAFEKIISRLSKLRTVPTFNQGLAAINAAREEPVNLITSAIKIKLTYMFCSVILIPNLLLFSCLYLTSQLSFSTALIYFTLSSVCGMSTLYLASSKADHRIAAKQTEPLEASLIKAAEKFVLKLEEQEKPLQANKPRYSRS